VPPILLIALPAPDCKPPPIRLPPIYPAALPKALTAPPMEVDNLFPPMIPPILPYTPESVPPISNSLVYLLGSDLGEVLVALPYVRVPLLLFIIFFLVILY